MRIENFGKYLKEIRGEMRQQDFAKPLGIAQNHLSNLENGNREPSIPLLLSLAKHYDIDIMFWFTDEDSQFSGAPQQNKDTLKDIAHGSCDFETLKFSEIYGIFSRLYVYLDTRTEPMLPADRRMLSDVLAACQRIMDSNERDGSGEGKLIRGIA